MTMPNWNVGASTPYWLPKFAPGEVSGQPTQGFPVPIPSGQMWSQTPYSQRMGLGAYINRYAGSVPGMVAAYQDMVDRMRMMFPKRAPAGAARWGTARQW